MGSITLKNIPDELHQRLRESAQIHRRSVTAEILSLLEAQLSANPQGVLSSIRGLQARHPVLAITQEDIDRYKREGRA